MEKRLILKQEDEAVVRMYGQGFGDCFLLALPREVEQGATIDLTNPVYIVIDSGVYHTTPDQTSRMQTVARSILEATGGRVDLLIASHEHYDHLCGFDLAKEIWQQIEIGAIWLGWTENPEHWATRKYDHEREALQLQVEQVDEVVRANLHRDPALALGLSRAMWLAGFGGVRELAPMLGTSLPSDDRLPEEVVDDIPQEVFFDNEASAENAEEMSPFRLSPFRPLLGADGTVQRYPESLSRPPKSISQLPHRVLSDFREQGWGQRFKGSLGKECAFLEPGQVVTVPHTAIDAYVLGPPTDPDFLSLALDEKEVYPKSKPTDSSPEGNLDAINMADLRLAVAADRAGREGLSTAIGANLKYLRRKAQVEEDEEEIQVPDETSTDTGSDFSDSHAPFDSLGLTLDEAEKDSFFQKYYFEGETGASRQIGTDWLRDTSQFALQMDKLINNTSLVLAFRLPSGKFMLFVGDAQVGNWLSWHTIKSKQWKRPDGSRPDYQPTIEEIFENTKIYKVGHHGSHNATLKAKGLEMMADGLIALVPTSKGVPQIANGWDIPLTSLLEGLKLKSGGQVVLPYDDSAYTHRTFMREVVETSSEKFPAMMIKKRDGNSVRSYEAQPETPVWRQIHV